MSPDNGTCLSPALCGTTRNAQESMQGTAVSQTQHPYRMRRTVPSPHSSQLAARQQAHTRVTQAPVLCPSPFRHAPKRQPTGSLSSLSGVRMLQPFSRPSLHQNLLHELEPCSRHSLGGQQLQLPVQRMLVLLLLRSPLAPALAVTPPSRLLGGPFLLYFFPQASAPRHTRKARILRQRQQIRYLPGLPNGHPTPVTTRTNLRSLVPRIHQ